MIREFEIRKRLNGLLQGRESLDDFDAWLTDASWNMHRDSSQAAQDLVDEIQLILAMHSNGDTTAAEMRADLKRLTAKAVVVSATMTAARDTVARGRIDIGSVFTLQAAAPAENLTESAGPAETLKESLQLQLA